MTKGSIIRYSEAELAWIKEHRQLARKEAHNRFCNVFHRHDVTADNYKALCTREGWKTGRTGQIEKGSTPWNEGKKMPPGKGGNHPNARRTQFKKGGVPGNVKYLGHERVSKDGYVQISIDEANPHTGFRRRYVLKHRYLWEKENGNLPEGMCLKCVDGNRQNTDPANWEAIPRGALPFLNGHRGYNYETMAAELKPTVLALAKVRHAKGAAKELKRNCGDAKL